MDHLPELARRAFKPRWTVLWMAVLLVLFAPRLQAAELFGLVGNRHVTINGFGVFGNITLSRSLDILEPREGKLETFDDIYIEDALWILSGELKRRGYLYPAIDAELYHENELVWSGSWADGDVNPDVTPDLSGDTVVFNIRAGVLFFFDSIEVTGMPEDNLEKVETYFYNTDRLIISRENRFFSNGRFLGGQDRLVLSLRELGYRDAKVSGKVISEDRETGAVSVSVSIAHGPVYYVNSLTIDAPDASEVTDELRNIPEGQRLTPDWLRNLAQDLRNHYYSLGYVDVAVEQKIDVLEQNESRAIAAVTLTVTPGKVTRIGKVSFENVGDTNQEMLWRQAGLKSGELLDRTKVEEGRDQLSKLGIFRTIRIEYDDTEEGEQDVIYDASMKKQTIVNLIVGVGSYDIVRGGFEVINNNLWGYAHQSHLTAIQSFKSTSADYTYTIPQIFGKDLDYFLSANYLRREEITFDREEYGGSTGLQRYFNSINTAASVQYNYGLVEARNVEFSSPPGPTKSLVSSITLKANRSELDNPVFPTDGWQVFGTSEFAFKALGGEVDFQRIEVGGAWHKPLTDNGLVFHAGYKTGVVTSLGPSSENIPVPKRFFLGGENTVRGYRRDQAAPVNAQGQQIGAVSYMLWQVEAEQRLTELFSVVAFVDTVGNAANIDDYPFNQVLISAGGGISIRTVVGPLRFEYGHNVKKRPEDPNGTFQVALGFPF